jgi:hypothetical protein
MDSAHEEIVIEDDVDSAYGGEDSEADTTTTLKSAVTNYIYDNGRRYNSFRSGSYW